MLDQNKRNMGGFGLMKNIREIKKANKGITLIALVITIIVLLILAGVAIATLTGENRNINKGTNCKK